jgi:hypothetical protein
LIRSIARGKMHDFQGLPTGICPDCLPAPSPTR